MTTYIYRHKPSKSTLYIEAPDIKVANAKKAAMVNTASDWSLAGHYQSVTP